MTDGASAQPVQVRFYAELNDFLPPGRRGVTFAHRVEGRRSIKDLIEALGVPHTEIDLILVNGEPVGFCHLVREGDRISVYPVFESIEVGEVTRVRDRPLREPRFVLDTHLGKLAAYLRMLGFDTLYERDHPDHELARIASSEGRILLSQDRGLLKRKVVTHGYCVRETNPRQQLVEVVRRFDLTGRITPFRRCMRCNGRLEPVPKASIVGRLPPKTRESYDEFSICTSCDWIYWKGPHHRRMQRLIEDVRRAAAAL